MKKIMISLIVSIACLIGLSISASACPAVPTEQTYSLSNGKTLVATTYGDEYFNYTVASDDYIVVPQNNQWYYATVSSCQESGINADKLISSGFRYNVDPVPPDAVKESDLSNYANLNYQEELAELESIVFGPQPLSEMSNEAFPFLKEQKLLVILVDFTDEKIQKSESYWSNKFFGTNSNSVNDYYKNTSENKISFSAASETYVGNDGTVNDGVVKVSLNYAHPNNNESEKWEKTREAVMAAADNYVDFSTYSSYSVQSKDLQIFIIYAGDEQSSNKSSVKSIWAHHSNASLGTYDSREVKGYSACGEILYRYSDTITPISLGTLCHELGHGMGLPDLYEREYNPERKSTYSSPFSLMSGGSSNDFGNTPSDLDPYCKMKLGIIDDDDMVIINPTYDSVITQKITDFGNTNFKMAKIPTNNSKIYYLVESRNMDSNPNTEEILFYVIDERYTKNEGKGKRVVSFGNCIYTASGHNIICPYTCDPLPCESDLIIKVLPSSGAGNTNIQSYRRNDFHNSQIEVSGNENYSIAYLDSRIAYDSTANSISTATGPTIEYNGELWSLKARETAGFMYLDTYTITSLEDSSRHLSYDKATNSISIEMNSNPSLSVSTAMLWSIFNTDNIEASIHYICPFDDLSKCIDYSVTENVFFINNVWDVGSANLNLNTNNRVAAITANANAFKIKTGDNYLNYDKNNGYDVTLTKNSESTQWFIEKVSNSGETQYTIRPYGNTEAYLTHNGKLSYYSSASNFANKWNIDKVAGSFVISYYSVENSSKMFLCFNRNSNLISIMSESQYEIDKYHSNKWELESIGRSFEDGSYVLSNGAKCIDSVNFATTNPSLQMYNFNGGSNQHWEFTADAEGYYTISAVYNSSLVLALDPVTNSVSLKPRSTSNIRKWKIYSDYYSTDFSIIISPQNDLTQYLACGDSGIVLSESAFSWKASLNNSDTIVQLPSGTYRIQNVKSGMYIDGMNGGAQALYQSEYSDEDQQLWDIDRCASGAYTITSIFSQDQALTYLSELQRNCMMPNRYRDDQTWIIRQGWDGTYRFISRSNPGYAIAVRGATTIPYEDLIIFGDNKTPNSRWNLIPIDYQIFENGTYRIENVKSGYYLDGMTKIDGSKTFKQDAYKDDNGQLWIFECVGNNYYTISAAYNPKLKVTATSSDSGLCVLANDQNSDTQIWKIVKNSDGECYLTSKAYITESMAVQGASIAARADMVLFSTNGTPNSKWIITPEAYKQVIPDGNYTFSNVKSGLFMNALSTDIPTGGQKIIQDSNSVGINAEWTVKYQGDGYYIISLANNNAINLNATKCRLFNVIHNSSPNPNYLLRILKNADGSYRFIPFINPDKALVVLGASTNPGAELIPYSDNGTKNGWWNATPVE